MNADDALRHLGDSTARAVAGVLEQFVPGGIVQGQAGIVPKGFSPLAGIELPAVAASVWYVDGVSGGNLFVITRRGARRLAAAMMGSETEETEDAELSELELSAVGEAMNQMMAAAAGATSSVLDEQIEIGPPTTRTLLSTEDVDEVVEPAPYATVVPFTVLGESCRLVQLVPTAFVLRMTRALDDLESAEEFDSTQVSPGLEGSTATSDVVRQLPVRLSVELGRTRMPIGRAVGLWPNAVVELDEAVDSPLLVTVNGRPFAHGRLLLAEEGEWALRIDRVLGATVTKEALEKEA